jgi:putative DNA primase/helicase
LETIRKALGDYAKQSDFDTFVIKRSGKSIRNDIARLKGARFVSAVEVERGERLATALVKQMTGDDTLLARFLYQEYFEFRPEFKILLACNHRPDIEALDYAIWRRIQLIPFHMKIPENEQDKKLPEKLEQELPGILAWAVAGCYRWRKFGLRPPDEVKNAVRAYQREMDVVGRFIDERCKTKAGAEVKVADLFQAFEPWCKDIGEKEMSKKAFGMELRRKGFQAFRKSSGRYYRGISLMEEAIEDSVTQDTVKDEKVIHFGEKKIAYSKLRKQLEKKVEGSHIRRNEEDWYSVTHGL